MYDAPHYKGSDKLKDKVALVTGGDSGIGRSVAVLFAGSLTGMACSAAAASSAPLRKKAKLVLLASLTATSTFMLEVNFLSKGLFRGDQGLGANVRPSAPLAPQDGAGFALARAEDRMTLPRSSSSEPEPIRRGERPAR
jgi:NAD(P)-dependent dehydrogenase (short-subunit alcohol dehydrogenase family)